MLTVVWDEAGRLLAACEWESVNEHGLPNLDGTQGTPETFCYILIQRIEMSPQAVLSLCMEQLIERLAAEMPAAKGAYWQTHRDPNRLVSRSRERWVHNTRSLEYAWK